jgi:predicted metal-dependent peptidase
MQEIDEQFLNEELNKTKAQMFIGGTGAFLGSLMCSLEFIWDETVQTAETDGVSLWWNPHWFLSLKPATRKTVLAHELWHPGLLHMIRRGNRDPEIWNQAADYRINNDLKKEGYTFEGIEWCCLNPDLDKGGRMVEEDIYDLLINSGAKPKPTWGVPGAGKGDMRDPTEETILKGIANVVKAVQAAEASGQAGTVPGGTKGIIKKFLTPVVPWEGLLYKFFSDLAEIAYTWARPNRRYTNMYLPSTYEEEGRLDHLIYYLDVSASITAQERLRFNSEVKYIKETFNPRKLTLVQFDTRIMDEKTFEESDSFDVVTDAHGSGTSLVCVREHIEKHQPTAAIIFSDLEVTPMVRPTVHVPIIWIRIGRGGGHVPTYGEVIYIRN